MELIISKKDFATIDIGDLSHLSCQSKIDFDNRYSNIASDDIYRMFDNDIGEVLISRPISILAILEITNIEDPQKRFQSFRKSWSRLLLNEEISKIYEKREDREFEMHKQSESNPVDSVYNYETIVQWLGSNNLIYDEAYCQRYINATGYLSLENILKDHPEEKRMSHIDMPNNQNESSIYPRFLPNGPIVVNIFSTSFYNSEPVISASMILLDVSRAMIVYLLQYPDSKDPHLILEKIFGLFKLDVKNIEFAKVNNFPVIRFLYMKMPFETPLGGIFLSKREV